MSTRSLSRRQFLLSASHAALASSVLSCATAPETEVRGKKSTPALRLSTSSIHFHGRPVEDARERIARLGFGAVDIWSGYQGCPHLDDVKKRLIEVTTDAVNRGAFGSPTFFVGKEMFFGKDQLRDVEESIVEQLGGAKAKSA